MFWSNDWPPRGRAAAGAALAALAMALAMVLVPTSAVHAAGLRAGARQASHVSSSTRYAATVPVELVSANSYGDSAGFTHLVGEVQNVGPGPAEFVQININEYSASNQLLATDFTYTTLGVVRPWQTASFDDIFQPPPGYDHASVSGITDEAAPDMGNHNFSVAVTNVYTDSAGYQHVVGSVTNLNTASSGYVQVILTFVDGIGNTVGSDFTYVSTDTSATMAAGQTASFEEIVPLDMPPYSTRTIEVQSSSPEAGPDASATCSYETTTTSAAQPSIPASNVFIATAPTRLIDTRPASGFANSGHTLCNDSTLDVQILGQAGIPSNATAVVLNVTVTGATRPSYLTAYPADTTRPLASNLNFRPGQTVPNLVEVPIGNRGAISLYNLAGGVDVVADVAGYAVSGSSGAGQYNPVPPARLVDTRPGSGQGHAGQTLGSNGIVTFGVTGIAGVPGGGVSAVVLNVTATNPSAASYLTVFPAGTSPPLASNVNFVPHQTVPNRVVVAVGSGGAVSILNRYGSVDVVVDIGGWFTDGSATSPTGAALHPLSPSRLCDTRAGNSTPCSGQTVGGGGTLVVQVGGAGGAAANASAAILNVTATGPTGAGYVTVYPDATNRPLASDLNFIAGQTVPNLVVVQVGSDGAVDLNNYSGATDLIVDVVGYFA